MERRDFLLNSCRACLGLLAVPALASLEGCADTKAMTGMTESKGLITVPLADIADKPGVTIHPKSLPDAVLVTKHSDGTYKALSLRCPHKGGAVQSNGVELECGLHHSTFDMDGNVTKGPAKSNLTSFPVEVVGDKLVIKVS